MEEEDDRPPSNLSSAAEELVSTVLRRAQRHVLVPEKNESPISDPENVGGEEPEVTKNIAWAACGVFTVDLGKEQIEEYVRTCWDWECPEDSRDMRGSSPWLASLEFLRTTEEPERHRSLHHYRLRCSVPTSRTPVPEATACVHFVVEVSQRARARAGPVEVRFVVESNRLVHTAGRSRFREKWLRDVIESKAAVRAAVDF